MKVSSLDYDEKYRVYQNPDNTMNYSDGEKNEQYVFDCLKSTKDTSIFSMELHNCIKDWPSEYHFTTYRANILRPLNVQENHQILEIGAGTGAITRYLGESGAKVTAVEGGLPRARCIAERCRDLENVTVICSNVEDLEFEEKFDIITLIGVFEYTAKYSGHEDPFHDALKSYGKLLKPNGSLVIAIENKLGLKYFAGYNEDHFGRPYFGIEDRYGEKDITTFGHEELKEMLSNVGYDSAKFLYPFPDYKIPKAIIADNGLRNNQFNEADIIRLTKERHYGSRPKENLLNEYLAWKSIADNALVKDLSNSFLIVASKDSAHDLIDNSLLAEFYTCARFEPYNTSTTFKTDGADGIMVKKKALGRTDDFTDGNDLAHNFTEEMEYIEGSNLHHLVTEALLKKNYDKYRRLMKEWANYVRVEITKTKSISDPKIEPHYFDAIPRNIIVDKKGNFHLFDQEWIVDQEFDLTFLLTRYLAEHRKKRGMYAGYSSSFLGFINNTLLACGLQSISKSKLNQILRKDEAIRNRIHRPGGKANRKVMKSFIQLFLKFAKDLKSYFYYDEFSQY